MVSRDEVARDDFGAISLLADPTRLQLYNHVAAADTPVTRDHMSVASGLERSVVGYHLDKLVDVGLLTANYARPEGHTGGPGAGRPAKWYERADDEFTVTLPPRAYQLVAELLARTLETAEASAGLRHHLEQLAADFGREFASTATDHDDAREEILDSLSALGFEPSNAGGIIRLRNCPFNQLARAHTDLVCNMNQALLTGLIEGLAGYLQPSPDDDPATCCVTLQCQNVAEPQ